jgi:kynureninase
MARLTAEARRHGVLIGWDCSHSIGAVPHALGDWGADFAFWCHYKYLNAGPGAVGGLYVNRRHHAASGGACAAPGLAGWFGSDKARQFDLTDTLAPAGGAGALQIGTPSILGMAPLAGALELHHEAGIHRLREKSLRLTAYLRVLIEARLARFNVWVATPREDERRGGHLALVHPDADRLCRALREAGVVPDFRAPDVIRLAPVPLYNRFVDCFDAVERLETIFVEKRHERLPIGREVVS